MDTGVDDVGETDLLAVTPVSIRSDTLGWLGIDGDEFTDPMRRSEEVGQLVWM